MLSNTPSRYGLLTRSLHWTLAILTMGLIAMGWWMMDLGYYDAWYYASRQWHETLGLVVWLLGLAFAVWHLFSRPPKSLTTKPLEAWAARIAHKLLYLALLTLPVAGYLIETADGSPLVLFDAITLPALGKLGEQGRLAAEWVHAVGAYSLLAIAAVHAAGALKHHFIDRDRTLMRMLRGS